MADGCKNCAKLNDYAWIMGQWSVFMAAFTQDETAETV